MSRESRIIGKFSQSEAADSAPPTPRPPGGYGGRIICAGIPRSGTTLVFRALMGLPPGDTTPRLADPAVIKTHSFRPAEFAGADKALFLFGDVTASVVSTRLRRYGRLHFRNCGAPHRDPATTDIFREDALNYTAMFEAWARPQPFDLACIRYEALYDLRPEIEMFLCGPLPLPPRRPRSTDPGDLVEAADIAAISSTYARLIDLVAAAPDLAIFRARTGGA